MSEQVIEHGLRRLKEIGVDAIFGPRELRVQLSRCDRQPCRYRMDRLLYRTERGLRGPARLPLPTHSEFAHDVAQFLDR